MKTPIAIISGYLGAGKTTLLKRIIDNLDRKFAILMNEFGEVSIDSQIIKGKNVNIQELSGGCVCCSLTGEFQEALKEIIDTYKPEIVIVETTGVAEPDAIVFDVEESFKDAKLDTVIIVADADAINRFPAISRIGEAQIEVADIILLNKKDLVNGEILSDIETRLKLINDKAHIFRTKNCDIDIDLLFSLEVEHRARKVHKKDHTKMECFVLDAAKVFKREEMNRFLSSIPQEVYRLKGFIGLEDGKTYLLNYVAGRWDFEIMEGEKKLVFIGEDIKKMEDDIKKGLEG